MNRILTIGVHGVWMVLALGCSGVSDDAEAVRGLSEKVAHPVASDLVVTGPAGMVTTIPVARSNGNGTFTVTTAGSGTFQAAAAASGATVLPADFNNDGATDICVTGNSSFTTIPCLIANGSGGFAQVNNAIGAFATWSAQSPTRLAEDFNGDGRADIALVGGSGFGSIPVAFSTGSGTFSVTNTNVSLFAQWASTAGTSRLTGDFNGDGKADIALVGGFTSLPVAFSNGNGSFTITNFSTGLFDSWSSLSGVVRLIGDFNGDGRSDIALTGVAGWSTLPVALSNGDGTFDIANNGVGNFATWAQTTSSSKLVGDFNDDGRDDIALVGGFTSLPIAFSTGGGTFSVTNESAGNFPTWASAAGVSRLLGDFNFDGKMDVALTGGSGWGSIPVAFSNGNGFFNVTNSAVSTFPSRAAQAGTQRHAGNFQF